MVVERDMAGEIPIPPFRSYSLLSGMKTSQKMSEAMNRFSIPSYLPEEATKIDSRIK